VLGLEQFELSHDPGASADHSRIIRLSYDRHDYVRLARRAYEVWGPPSSGKPASGIATVTGAHDRWPSDGAIPSADTSTASPQATPFALHDAREIRRHWPRWRIEDDVTGLWQAAVWPTRSAATGASTPWHPSVTS
jgi:hypothetical protein